MRRDKQDQSNSIGGNDTLGDRDTARGSKPPIPDSDFEHLFERGNEIVDMLLALRIPARQSVPFILCRECGGWTLTQIRPLISAMTRIIVDNARRTHDDVESGRIVEKFYAQAAANEVYHPFKGRTKEQIAQSARSMVGTYLDLCDVLQSVDTKFAMAQKLHAEGERDVSVLV